MAYLPNDGYTVGTLSGDLFESLLEEGLRSESNEIVPTGLKTPDGVETCPHYASSKDNSEKLFAFLTPHVQKYMEIVPYMSQYKVLKMQIIFHNFLQTLHNEDMSLLHQEFEDQ